MPGKRREREQKNGAPFHTARHFAFIRSASAPRIQRFTPASF
jgi:hypothetical protein